MHSQFAKKQKKETKYKLTTGIRRYDSNWDIEGERGGSIGIQRCVLLKA